MMKKNTLSTGKVTLVKDFLIEVKGFVDAPYFGCVEIPNKARGYISEITPQFVKVVLVEKTSDIFVGDEIILTSPEYQALYSPDSLGCIIDIFGNNLLNNKKFRRCMSMKIENPNTAIMDRSDVKRPLHTGISGIDMMYPIGMGQRQLIIGEKKTGKTQIALDTIVNLRNKKVLCIYIAVGKTKKEIKEIYNNLQKRDSMKKTIIIAATNDQLPSVRTLTPFVGLSIAEEYLKKKKDVLVIIDDLKAHADTYREISLLSNKTPGRGAYPPDIFYLHSRLLEKGCQHVNGGSITILPIVETKTSDITDYISTNIISITDGQIVLSRKSFENGQKPAINFGLSVSRLGGAVQTDDMKRIGNQVRRELLAYLEKKSIYELTNLDDLTPSIRKQLEDGNAILEALEQYKFMPLKSNEMVDLFGRFSK
ncbi:MAG: hypothetical protein ACRCUP_01160 [Mycoplasmatales bacterium]